MCADGIHGEIGKELKKKKHVFTFNDVVCGKGSKFCKTSEIDIHDFYHFAKENKCRNTKGNIMPLLEHKRQHMRLLEDVVKLKFVKGSAAMEIKTSFLDECKKIDFLKRKFLQSGALKTFPVP